MAEPKTILCIDDQRDSLDVFRAHFEKGGDKVLTASTGKQGLELLAVNKVDAVVLDYQMSSMSGAAVLQVVKRAALGVPVLVLTELSIVVPQDVRNAATVVATKGMSISKLTRSVDTILETKLGRSSRRGTA